MSNQIPPPYPEEQRWNSQPQASYPNMGGYGNPAQPQAGYQNQGSASPYPAGGQAMFPQQPGYAGNIPYAGNNPYAAPPATYQPPAPSYMPPPVPGVYAPYMSPPYGMIHDPYSNKATTGLIFGIISVVIWLIPYIGWLASIVCGIIGIIFSAQGRRSLTKRGTATTGMVLSIIGTVLVPGLILCGILFGLAMFGLSL